MAIRFTARAAVTAAALAGAATVQADSHMDAAGAEADMQFAPAELMACTFKDDKSWDDLKALTDSFTAWADANDPGYSYWIFTPRFREGGDLDVAWVGSWSSGAAMGSSWDAWLADDDGVGKAFDETLDCQSSMAAVTDIYVPTQDWRTEERGVAWFNRCTLEDGKRMSDAVAAHHAVDSAMAELGSPSFSWAFLPALGFGDVKFDYYHVESWASYADLGAGFDGYFNKGGWKTDNEAMTGTASCGSPNLYDFHLKRAGEG